MFETSATSVVGEIGIVRLDRAAALAESIESALRDRGRNPWVGDTFDDARWPQTKVVISIGVPCGAAEFDSGVLLRGVVSPLLGYDWIDVSEATQRGIAVVNGEVPENRDGMAEATILLILALLYRLQDAEAALRHDPGGHLRQGRLLRGKTVGLIGSGGIAQGITSRLIAWGCEINVSTRTGVPPKGTRAVPLDELVASSDVVVVATSLNGETHHLLNRDRITLMKPDAVLVNTARGAIIDEFALVDALRRGRIAGAALDVFEVEPLPSDHPLRSLSNVILTPHAIGHTAEGAKTVPVQAASNALSLASGEMPASCRNPDIIDSWIAREMQPTT